MEDENDTENTSKPEGVDLNKLLNALKSNPEFANASKNEPLIQKKHGDIKQLWNKARYMYFSGNLLESAKVFRQIAKIIHELNFKIENKGEYAEKNSLNDLTGKEWLRHTKSWVVFDGKSSDIPKEVKQHPATFPPDLIEYFIEFFTKKGGWVLDPFMGIGSTAVACQNLDRNCWGTEINLKYWKYAKERIESRFIPISDFLDKSKSHITCEIFNQDCRSLLKIYKEHNFPPLDFCITSPPYWNILETSRGGVKSTHKQRMEEGTDEKYSNDVNDLGNISDYQEYLEQIENIFNIIYDLLKADGYLMIIAQNVRPKKGEMMPIAWDIANRLSKKYTLRQEFIWCQDQKLLGIWGYPKTYVSNVHHHYCLVFQKSGVKM